MTWIKKVSSDKASSLVPGYEEQVVGTYKGVLYDAAMNPVWKCSHHHTKPEYNASYRGRRDRIWERSAFGCAEDAKAQLAARYAVHGSAGMIGHTDLHNDQRMDVKQATTPFGDMVFRLVLDPETGERWMRFWVGDENDHDFDKRYDGDADGGIHGAVRLSYFADESRMPLPDNLGVAFIQHLLTTLAMVLPDVFGLAFRNDQKTVDSRGEAYGLLSDKERKVYDRLAPIYGGTPSQITSKKKKAKEVIKPKEYTLETVREDGVKKFLLRDPDGNVVEEHLRRGTAVRSLVKHNKV